MNDNALRKHVPNIDEIWVHNKNEVLGLFIDNLTKGSGKKAWWRCKDCGSESFATISSRVTSLSSGNSGCPYCRGFKINHTNDLWNNPHIEEFDFELNESKPCELHKGTHKKLWWRCKECDNTWQIRAMDRANKNTGCPYCAGKKASKKNSLATLRPDIAKEWDYEKNKLTPHEVTLGSEKKVWWKCEQGHEWKTTVNVRAYNKSDCPYCGNRKVLKGYNDLGATHPELAKYITYEEEKYIATAGSAKKIHWTCIDCNTPLGYKSIKNIIAKGLSCHLCSNTASRGERAIALILKNEGIKFEPEKSFSWSDGRRYDFYLPELKLIIEAHGEQHYREIEFFHSKEDRTFEKTQAIDKWKEEIAKEKGLNYIIIDVSHYNTKDIVQSILNNKDFKKIVNTSKLDVNKITAKINQT